MLTVAQKTYLTALAPEKANKTITIYPYLPQSKNIANQVMDEVRRQLPEAKQYFIGAAALQIAGTNDVDLNVIEIKFTWALAVLTKLFGKPVSQSHQRFAQWEFNRDGFLVDLCLNNDLAPQLKEQLSIYRILSTNEKLKVKYEKMKVSMSGKSYKDYQTAKYEFYNEALDL